MFLKTFEVEIDNAVAESWFMFDQCCLVWQLNRGLWAAIDICATYSSCFVSICCFHSRTVDSCGCLWWYYEEEEMICLRHYCADAVTVSANMTKFIEVTNYSLKCKFMHLMNFGSKWKIFCVCPFDKALLEQGQWLQNYLATCNLSKKSHQNMKYSY